MPLCFDPRFQSLPAAQREIWPLLAPAPELGLVLYGGTAVALQLGHRQSIDFDFFGFEPLNKDLIRRSFTFAREAAVLQDQPDTLVVSADMPSGPVKVSFFGGISFGRVGEPVQTRDNVLQVASLDDLMATKLKAILDRAEAKDYRDLAVMLRAGISLPKGLATFKLMFKGEPAEALRALGYFGDGDLSTLSQLDRRTLQSERDRVRDLPKVALTHGSLALPIGDCDEPPSSLGI